MANDRSKSAASGLYTRPAAAGGAADAESGAQSKAPDAEDHRRSLAALTVMRDRGLLPEAEYQARKAALDARLAAS